MFLSHLPFVPDLPAGMEHKAQHIVFMIVVGALGWFFIGCVYVAQDVLLRRYDVTVADNIRARAGTYAIFNSSGESRLRSLWF